ncbi:MAG: hypothetical protein ACHREM_23475 [Polyangiales bacterium]
MTARWLMVFVPTIAVAGAGCHGPHESPKSLETAVLAKVIAGDVAGCEAFYTPVHPTAHELERDGDYFKTLAAQHHTSCEDCVRRLRGAKQGDGMLSCLLPPSSPTKVYGCSDRAYVGELSVDPQAPAPRWTSIETSIGNYGGEHWLITLSCADDTK